jgi:hypothetical protein
MSAPSGRQLLRRWVRRWVDIPWLVTVGHYGWPVPWVAAVAMRWMPTYATAYAWTPLLAAGVVAATAHGSGLCPGCAPRMVPSQPPDLVERWRWLLRFGHHHLRHPLTWTLAAAFLALTFGEHQRLALIPLSALFGLELGAMRQHSKLRPWCPYCSGGGQDDQPNPAPSGPGGLAVDQPRSTRWATSARANPTTHSTVVVE